MINNIIQDQTVVIGKIIINQFEITNIINKLIIRTIDFDKMLWDVSIVEKKVMSWMIILYGRKLLKKKKIPNQKLE
jgi:hypothetical protein